MIIRLDAESMRALCNPHFRSYAEIYQNINDDFLEQINNTGIRCEPGKSDLSAEKIARLRQKGASVRNNSKSIFANWISPACKACNTGEGSITLYLSLMCNRDCFFCFNANQEQYEYFLENKKECIDELESLQKAGQKISHLALSGGEPLLHPQEAVRFLQRGRQLYPKAYLRLYTNGDFVNQVVLQQLKAVELNEIRFSIKIDDPPDHRQDVYDRITLAKRYIPNVMVEMPVFPGRTAEMKSLLLKLNELNITGINLLEFCFPFNNVQEYINRSFQIKTPPFQVLYDYWYAAGLPVAGSEAECLDLMEFIIDQKLQIGAHYCSLENKLTSQLYKANYGQKVSRIMYFSPKDYLFKSAKVFGDDMETVLNIFKRKRIDRYQINQHYHFLEFHVSDISKLADLEIEIGISSNVVEDREDGKYLRELRIDLAYPAKFHFCNDI